MTLSRRSFFTELAIALAAPVIVKAEHLMKLAPAEIIRPDISLQLISNYDIGAEVEITRLDVLYGHLHVKPEWTVMVPEPGYTLDTYSEQILKPMVDRLQKQVADAIMYGQGFIKHTPHETYSIGLADLLRDAREATNSSE